MKLFREDNTEGYTAEELKKLNSEWEKTVADKNIKEGTDAYNEAAKEFSDQIARR